MFAWPYTLKDSIFETPLKNEIEEKIQEDIQLIRGKEQRRKEVMERIFRKINVVNKLGRQFNKIDNTEKDLQVMK